MTVASHLTHARQQQQWEQQRASTRQQWVVCVQLIDWLIDGVKVLRPAQHKIGHFGDVPQANLLAWYGKTKPNTTEAHIHPSKEMYYNTK